MRRTLLISFVASFSTAFSSPASADVSAQQFVEKEITTRDENGNERVTRIAADTVAPGEEVIYALRFSNEGAEPADDVALVMPVPTEVSYVEGSVTGGLSKITFSADGGQTYVARGRLTVREEGIERPAKSNEITHIKWLLEAPLAANEEREVSYRAVLK